MLDLIQNNPYRLLGIYSNSPAKEKVANHNKLKAFLNAGKVISFPLDLPTLFPTTTRTIEIISQASAELTLPNEQLKYAQFWFMKATPLDDIAMNHLFSGNINGAISIWEKKDNVSSLQNRITCALIQGNYSTALFLAEKLYSLNDKEFVCIVLGENNTADVEKLRYSFLDELCSAIGATEVLSCLKNNDWKQYVSKKSIKPLIDMLQSAVEAAKSSKGKGITARYNAGTKLMNDTKATLTQLGTLLPISDLQYQMIADKIGLEILQCSIDYYNGSEAANAVHKAMKLQSYALSIVVGKIAKDRCKANVDILQQIIDNLPPVEVFDEYKAIKEELHKFCQLPDKICHAVTLLNKTKPHLQSIKAKLSATNAYYLKISTQVIGNALHNVIEEVNAIQRHNDFFEMHSDREAISALARLATVKATLEAAWKATTLMDTFDMEWDFKTNRYNQNRSILKKMCEQCGISTAYKSRVPNGTGTIDPDPNPPILGCYTKILLSVIGSAIGGVIGCMIDGTAVAIITAASIGLFVGAIIAVNIND